MEQCHHKTHLIKIGREDMRLFRQVARTAYNIIASRFDRGDIRHVATGRFREGDDVTDGYGIGGTDTLEPEVSFDFTLHVAAIVSVDEIAAACIFYDGSFHEVQIYEILRKTYAILV